MFLARKSPIAHQRQLLGPHCEHVAFQPHLKAGVSKLHPAIFERNQIGGEGGETHLRDLLSRIDYGVPSTIICYRGISVRFSPARPAAERVRATQQLQW